MISVEDQKAFKTAKAKLAKASANIISNSIWSAGMDIPTKPWEGDLAWEALNILKALAIAGDDYEDECVEPEDEAEERDKQPTKELKK